MKWRLVKQEVCAVNTEHSREKEGWEHWILSVDLYCKWDRRFKIHVFCDAADRRPTSLLDLPLPPAVTYYRADARTIVLLFVDVSLSLHALLPGPCCVVLAMIHLTRQHFIRDLRVSRGFCHLEPSVCPLGFGSFPLASGRRPPSTTFSSGWGEKTETSLLFQ